MLEKNIASDILGRRFLFNSPCLFSAAAGLTVIPELAEIIYKSPEEMTIEDYRKLYASKTKNQQLFGKHKKALQNSNTKVTALMVVPAQTIAIPEGKTAEQYKEISEKIKNTKPERKEVTVTCAQLVKMESDAEKEVNYLKQQLAIADKGIAKCQAILDGKDGFTEDEAKAFMAKAQCTRDQIYFRLSQFTEWMKGIRAGLIKAIAEANGAKNESALYTMIEAAEDEVDQVVIAAINSNDAQGITDVNLASTDVNDSDVSNDPDRLTYDDNCYSQDIPMGDEKVAGTIDIDNVDTVTNVHTGSQVEAALEAFFRVA